MLKNESIKKELATLRINLVNSIKELVNIPSVIGEASAKYPFGENIDKALRKTLEICQSLGFKTYYDTKGYYGYAEVCQGDELIGILGHLDVVPTGALDMWRFNLFAAVLEEGKPYGKIRKINYGLHT